MTILLLNKLETFVRIKLSIKVIKKSFYGSIELIFILYLSRILEII
jgi:hypothetical protein